MLPWMRMALPDTVRNSMVIKLSDEVSAGAFRLPEVLAAAKALE